MYELKQRCLIRIFHRLDDKDRDESDCGGSGSGAAATANSTNTGMKRHYWTVSFRVD